jgi:multiple antibiotic resistance protein
MTFSPEYVLYVKALVGVLAIVNPMGAIPVFLSLSTGRIIAESQQIARKSAIAVALLLITALGQVMAFSPFSELAYLLFVRATDCLYY